MAQNNDINTSALMPGTWIKNYKELCTLLEVPVRNGYQKKKQLEDFERYFAYEKSGIKFFITEVYDTPLPEKQTHHNSKYVKYIQNILLSYLAEQSEEQINIKKAQLYLLLGMINDRYYKFHNNNKLLEILPDISKSVFIALALFICSLSTLSCFIDTFGTSVPKLIPPPIFSYLFLSSKSFTSTLLADIFNFSFSWVSSVIYFEKPCNQN